MKKKKYNFNQVITNKLSYLYQISGIVNFTMNIRWVFYATIPQINATEVYKAHHKYT